MFRRFHHGHSTAIGFLLALSLQRNTLLFSLLVFCTGVFAGRAWGFWLHVAEAVRSKLLRAKREPIPEGPQPVYHGRDRIPF